MFTVTEPHPTVQANAYTHSGRGGAGNTFRAPSYVTPAAGVPTPLTKTESRSSSSYSTASTATRFYAGRGGAGNACPVAERRSFSLDDEYAHAAAIARASASGHVGRGGAGNFYKTRSDVNSLAGTPYTSTADKVADKIATSLRKLGRKGSDASDASDTSDASVGSARSGFFRRH